MAFETLRNQFLIAMPGLADENFSHSVTLMCEHNADGSLGVVINRPTDLNLHTMLEHLELDAASVNAEIPVYWGGPVKTERGFVIHGPFGDWESCMKISEHLGVTTSRDILEAIGRGEGPEHYLVALGCAGWDAGQLDEEMLHNAWLSTPAESQIIFEYPPEERWDAATRLLGVDPENLSTTAGHA